MQKKLKELYADLPQQSGKIAIWQGLEGLSQMLVVALNAPNYPGPIVIITPDLLSLQRIKQELKFFLTNSNNQHLPIVTLADAETLPYDYFSPHPDLISARLRTLQTIPNLTQGIILVAISTILHLLPPRDFVANNSLVLEIKQMLNIENFRARLQRSGYHVVSQVMEHGEYAVRGSIIDIFPMGSITPYRIDLFGDEIDSIRTFDPESQLSQAKINAISLLPAKEFPLTEEAITHFRKEWRDFFPGDPTNIPLYQNITNGESAPGIEYYLKLFFPKLNNFFDYLPKNSLLISLTNVMENAEHFWQEISKRFVELSHDQSRPILPASEIFISCENLAALSQQFPQVVITDTKPALITTTNDLVNFVGEKPPIFNLNTDKESELLTIKEFFTAPQTKCLLVIDSLGRQEHLLTLLRKIAIQPEPCETWSEFIEDNNKTLAITIAPLEQGLKLNLSTTNQTLAIITETELFAKTIVKRARASKTKNQNLDNIIRNLTELTLGAPVVHIEHGVGRYLGLKNLTVSDIENEFLVLEYANQAKLYVPVTALHLISRYTGADSEHAPLDHLGAMKWQKTKAKAKQQIRDIAVQLLNIYAKRAAQTGFGFQKPGEDFQKFVDLFPFEETEDQAEAINAVISDMIKPMPMDRIICGDVGFGKTEVAMRAAFIAASQSKQVAMLAPTTLLVEQHYQNFLDRFAKFPMRLAMLSRFRSVKEQQQVIDGLKQGNIDIVIGTHKLLQPTIEFKNLGLLIVDEEHRFGVHHKERIKAITPNIDILTLTATPIPRTLNMALSGLRNFSIIATPPHGRLSIKTFVREKHNYLLREAIMREILRGGQVYFLHNDIMSIARVAEELRILVPEARLGIAHGQMREKELENIMHDFYNRRINLLLCTTIIESGLDIPNANTIIIDRADRFGLADLHQLRGRVGRSHHQAYAYLLTPEEKALSSNAKNASLPSHKWKI